MDGCLPMTAFSHVFLKQGGAACGYCYIDEMRMIGLPSLNLVHEIEGTRLHSVVMDATWFRERETKVCRVLTRGAMR